MATLKDFRTDYQQLSGIASEVSRKLGFAGIAIIWIFKVDSANNTFTLATELYYAGTFIVLSLALDLLQYLSGSLTWGLYWRYKEKEGVAEDAEIKAPRYFNWPAVAFFWLKLVLMIIAYYQLLEFMLSHISSS